MRFKGVNDWIYVAQDSLVEEGVEHDKETSGFKTKYGIS
jgi:hypothetical protein